MVRRKIVNINKNKEIKNAKIYKFQKILRLELPSVVVISGAIYFKIKKGNIKKRRNLKHQDL